MSPPKERGPAPVSNGAHIRLTNELTKSESSTRRARSRLPQVDPNLSVRGWEEFGKRSAKAERAKAKCGGAYR